MMFDKATTLTFDVVGTLIDFETGILNWWQPVLRRHGVEFSDNQFLGWFGEAEAVLQHTRPELPYTDMLPLIYWQLAGKLGFEGSHAEADSFPASISDWPAFDDSAQALKALGEHFQLVAFTNADAWACSAMSRTLGEPFDEVVTCDEAGINKPGLGFFRYGMEKLGVRPEQLVHVAQSQYHDMAPARELGVATVWIERRYGQEGSGATPSTDGIVQPDLHLTSLEELSRIVVRGSDA